MKKSSNTGVGLNEILQVSIDLVTGNEERLIAPFDFNIAEWTIWLNKVGSASVDIMVAPNGTIPDGDWDLCSPTVVGDYDRNQSGLSLSLDKDDYIVFKVNSADIATKAVVCLHGTRR